MAFLLSLRRLASGGMLPFILAASPPLRHTSSLVSASNSSEMSSVAIIRHLPNPVPPLSGRGGEGGRFTHGRQKHIKKCGFNAVIRWCAYHQELQGRASAAASASLDATETKQMDCAVLDWVNGSAESFSCGQSLVILTFLCDVLQRQTPPSAVDDGNAAAASSSWASHGLMDRLTQTIALLLTHVVTSEQLERQPFLVLLSAVYGLHRLTDVNPLRLPPIVLESITPPTALWLPLRHQLGTFVAGLTPTEGDAAVHLDALLTACLLFNESTCPLYFGKEDKTMEKAALRLLQLVRPALEASRKARVHSSSRVSVSATGIEGVLSTVKEGGRVGGAAAAPDATADAEDASPPPQVKRTGIRVEDCRRIMWHLQHRSVVQRLDILEYLLWVVIDPATLPPQEMRRLPALLFEARNTAGIKSRELADAVIAVRGEVELPVLVKLLPLVKNAAACEGVLVARLRGRTAQEVPLAPADASVLLTKVSVSLPWGLRVLLLLRSLAEIPEVLGGVEAALRSVREGHMAPPALPAEKNDGAPPASDAPAKVLLSPLLCHVLQFLFVQELRATLDQDPMNPEVPGSLRQAEALAIAGAVVRRIDWQRSTTDPATISERPASRGEEGLSSCSTAIAALAAYMASRHKYRFLGPDDAIDDRTLLNAFVVPVLRTAREGKGAEAIPLLNQVLQHVTSVVYRRQLVERAARYEPMKSYSSFFRFVVYFMTPATELRVLSPNVLQFMTRQRSLAPRDLGPEQMARLNLCKAYTTILTRSLRFWLAAHVGSAAKESGRSATWRDVADGWCSLYLKTLLSQSQSQQQQPAGVPSEDAASAEAGEGVLEGFHDDTSQDLSRVAVGVDAEGAADVGEARIAADQPSDGVEGDNDGGTHDAVRGGEGETLLFDDAFTSAITDDDVEAVLSLMLVVGVKVTSRALAFLTRRFRESLTGAVGGEATAIPATAVAEAWANVSSVAAAESESGGGVAGCDTSAPPAASSRLLPAHFVFAVRFDGTLALPLTLVELKQLLTTCDLLIFHHVLSAWFLALKRRRTRSVLGLELNCAALAFAVLLQRLTAACLSTSTSEGEKGADCSSVDEAELSTVAFKSVVHLLYHLSELPPSTEHLVALVEAIHSPAGKEFTAPASRGAAAAGTDSPPASEGEHDCPLPDIETELPETLLSLRNTHATTSASVLQVVAFLTATQLKELALAHLHRLSVFFPDAAAMAFLQLRPQLGTFTQRELLQVSTQYPVGWADVLAVLEKVDLHASVDLREFVPMAKKLPIQISEAVIRAHVPTLTIVWVTRVLSALAAHHEEVSISLLQMLLARVEAVTDCATESDKNLLLLILQGYLLFEPASPRALQEKDGAEVGEKYATHTRLHSSSADDRTWMENIGRTPSWKLGQRPVLSAEEQARRTDLVRHCCDALMSLEAITTLEQLRTFLNNYPSSLHQLREQGVVSTVEHKLLPAMVSTAAPVKWVELDTLVRLLAEHGVLKASTTQYITHAVFTPAALAQLQQTALASLQGNGAAVLTGCLRIAITCADSACHQPSPSSSSSAAVDALSRAVETTLDVFDEVPEWLAALTSLVPTQGSSSPQSASATAGSAALTSSQLTVARRLCELLLQETAELSSSDFARLLQCLSRLKAWDLVLEGGHDAPATVRADFQREFRGVFARADAHSRCVLLRALSTERGVFRDFETMIFRTLLGDVAVLSPEDLEVVLTAALAAKDVTLVEQLLDMVGTRLLPVVDQCRRSTLVRLLQCHAAFHVEDKAVTAAVLGALERQSSIEVKLDAAQVITVLNAIAQLNVFEAPERLVVLCFQRLERIFSGLTPTQLYQVGQLILELEMGYLPCIQTLVTTILESRDGPRGHRNFQGMTEALCDVYEGELSPQVRATRLRKRRQKGRLHDFYAAQERVRHEARLAAL